MSPPTQITFALQPHAHNRHLVDKSRPPPTGTAPVPVEKSSIASPEPSARPVLVAIVDEPAPPHRQTSPVSYPARRYIHSPKSQSLPTIPSLEELASDDDTSFTSSTLTSETSQSLSTSSGSGSTETLNERILSLSLDDEEFDYISMKTTSNIRPTTPLPSPQCPDRGGRRRRSFDNVSFKNIIYSTGMPPYDPFAVDKAAENDLGMDPIETLREIPGEEPLPIGIAVTPIPFAGLAEDEEWHPVDALRNTSDDLSTEHAEQCIVQHARSEILNWAYSVSAPVFFPEPPSSGRTLIPTCAIDLDEHTECLDSRYIEETTSHSRIKRKSVPESHKTLTEISREVLLRQINAHKPVTTSLLTLHEDMIPWQRLRRHPARTYRGRVAPDGDSLRRGTLQRNAHQVHSGLPFSPLSPALSVESNLEPELKPQLFPRAGDLLRLHRADSTSLIDDWRLGTLCRQRGLR
jgi:hypothetical protein